MTVRLRTLLLMALSLALVTSGCGPKLSPDTLYGVWKGESKRHGPTLLTFIKNNRCELQHYRDKDPQVKVGTWRIKDNRVYAEFPGYPLLKMEIDFVEADDGWKRERLIDEANGLVVVKM